MRALACLVAFAACSGPHDAFTCMDNAMCRMGGVVGTCETTGFCSFPDATCPNGSRYGDAAGDGLGGQCVGAGGSDDSGIPDGPPAQLGAWAAASSVPVMRYTHATATSGDYFYVIGGIQGSTLRDDVWFAKINTAAIVPSAAVPGWTQTTTLPQPRRTFGAAADAGFLYTFGGRTDTTGDTPDVLSAPINPDGTLGSWTPATAMPLAMKCQAVAQVGAFVYVVGGKHGNNAARATVLVGRMSAGDVTWLSSATLDSTFFNTAAVAVDGYLYVFGGCTGGDHTCATMLDIVEVAKINTDGSLGAFSHTSALGTPRWHHTAAASAAKNTIYVLGGTYINPATSAFDTPDVLGAHVNNDGSLSPWQMMTALPHGHQRATSAVIGNFLVFVAGDTQVSTLQ